MKHNVQITFTIEIDDTNIPTGTGLDFAIDEVVNNMVTQIETLTSDFGLDFSHKETTVLFKDGSGGK